MGCYVFNVLRIEDLFITILSLNKKMDINIKILISILRELERHKDIEIIINK